MMLKRLLWNSSGV